MAARLPLILLPPSEGKTPGGDGPPWAPGTMRVDLDDRRLQVMRALRAAMRADAATRAALLGVKGAALAAATAANRAVGTAPTMPAIERYRGVLYGALDVPTLTRMQRSRLDSSVLVVSGLWGLVAPDDPIPDYKLKMGRSLRRLGPLASYWRDDLTAALAERSDGRVVWNLLPNEHAAAWRMPPAQPGERCTVRFLDLRPDGSAVAVSHWNKFLKGALVRHLLAHPGTGAEELAGWEHPTGYRLDPARTEVTSAGTVLSFVRAAAEAT